VQSTEMQAQLTDQLPETESRLSGVIAQTQRQLKEASMRADDNWRSLTKEQATLLRTSSELEHTRRLLQESQAEGERLRKTIDDLQRARSDDRTTWQKEVRSVQSAKAAAEADHMQRAAKYEDTILETRALSAAQLAQQKEERELEESRLQREVGRLRKVQEETFKLSGGGGGGAGERMRPEARQMLFYESLKCKDPNRPSSMSWRGVTETLSIGAAATTAPIEVKKMAGAWRAKAKRAALKH